MKIILFLYITYNESVELDSEATRVYSNSCLCIQMFHSTIRYLFTLIEELQDLQHLEHLNLLEMHLPPEKASVEPQENKSTS